MAPNYCKLSFKLLWIFVNKYVVYRCDREITLKPYFINHIFLNVAFHNNRGITSNSIVQVSEASDWLLPFYRSNWKYFRVHFHNIHNIGVKLWLTYIILSARPYVIIIYWFIIIVPRPIVSYEIIPYLTVLLLSCKQEQRRRSKFAQV